MNTRQETKTPGSLDPNFAQDGVLIFPAEFSPTTTRVRNDGKILTLGSHEGAAALMRHLVDGDLDDSFGEGGVKPLPDTVEEASFEIAADNSTFLLRSLVFGSEGVIQLVKLLPDGDLDTRFGLDGTCQLKISEYYDSIQDIVFQPDGKIVVLVRSPDQPVFPNFEDYFLVRIDNGHLDRSFGQNATGIAPLGRDLSCLKAALTSDGRFVVASSSHAGLRLYGCRSNGQLDPDFGEGGAVTIPVENATYVLPADLTAMPNNKVLIAGSAQYASGEEHTLTARITADGTADPGFNGGTPNVVRIPGANSQNLFVRFPPDGKVVTAGVTTGTIETSQIVLMRFLDNGTMDPTFGNLGSAIHDWGGFDLPFYVGLQSGKGLVVGGRVVGTPVMTRQCSRYLL